MNKLRDTNSIYLLQHAKNPINWYPWGKEVLEKAKTEDKPIFLSIGYAACHWCHVMEQETFSDQSVATFMNSHFVSIKVDREERPDIDKIFMDAIMAMTGRGGWPLSVFLTPDGVPFYGGTYFPPTPRYGMPSFIQIAQSIQHNWSMNRENLINHGKEIKDHLDQTSFLIPSEASINISSAINDLLQKFNWENGGWGFKPKFPHPIILDLFLLNIHEKNVKDALKKNLDLMIQGGFYDLARGGFHRYSTDEKWVIPHFEKMLYDNAQLALTYMAAGYLLNEQKYKTTAESTLTFLKTELMDENGLFWSSIDADSEHEEGKYYLWKKSELVKEIESAGLSVNDFDFSPLNHLDSKMVLRFASPSPNQYHMKHDHQLFKNLRNIQTKRLRPITDDKILVDWNALTISAFLMAGLLSNKVEYLEIAKKTASEIKEKLYLDGVLYHSYRDGKIGEPGFLGDYAQFINSLLTLFNITLDRRWLDPAVDLTKNMLERFYRNGKFYDSEIKPDLFIHPQTIEDNVTPSGISSALEVLIRMNSLEFNPDYQNIIEVTLKTYHSFINKYPLAAGKWLQVIQQFQNPPYQLIVVTPDENEDLFLPKKINKFLFPGQIYIGSTRQFNLTNINQFQNKGLLENKITYYLCKNHTCSQPTTKFDEIKLLLNQNRNKD